MKIEKKLKSRKGFTLVELVVVIAVLAILAGVGTVAYSGYIKKADEAADVSQLAAIKTAADAAAAASPDHFTVDSISVEASGGKVSKITVAGKKPGGTEAATSIVVTLSDGVYSSETGNSDFKTFMSGNTFTFKSDTYKDGAHWSSTGWAKGSSATTGG